MEDKRVFLQGNLVHFDLGQIISCPNFLGLCFFIFPPIMQPPILLGHQEIDTQHAQLFHCIKHLNTLAGRRYSNAQVEGLLQHLAKMLREHFESEEAVMRQLRSIPAKLLEQHYREHEAILTELQTLADEGQQGREYDLNEVCRRARVWVEQHIHESDSLLIPFLRDHRTGTTTN